MKNSKSKSVYEITDLKKMDPKEFWKRLQWLISRHINPENWFHPFKDVLRTPPPIEQMVYFYRMLKQACVFWNGSLNNMKS